MRVPRWIVGFLLSCSAVTAIGSAAWLWIEWPTWTQERFIAVVAKGRFDEANELLEAPVRWLAKPQGEVDFVDCAGNEIGAVPEPVWQGWFEQLFVMSQRRNLADLLAGRQTFSTWGCDFEFTTQLGKVSFAYRASGYIDCYPPGGRRKPQALLDYVERREQEQEEQQRLLLCKPIEF